MIELIDPPVHHRSDICILWEEVTRTDKPMDLCQGEPSGKIAEIQI
jgi:hypothetical protein